MRCQARRKRFEPVDPKARRLEYRPWDVYAVLHPEAARRYEEALAALERREAVYSTG